MFEYVGFKEPKENLISFSDSFLTSETHIVPMDISEMSKKKDLIQYEKALKWTLLCNMKPESTQIIIVKRYERQCATLRLITIK